ncbi:MAG: isoprenylcysteine carboxylmethyltransferase family protein [Flavobacteriales bacterium]
MSDHIKIALRVLWIILVAYWTISAIRSKRSAHQETILKQILLYWLPLIVAALLLGPGEWFGHALIREQFVPHTNLVGMVGLAFCSLGVALACWSRYLLGRNWSLAVQKKEDHTLIVRGPYKLVRHPIYTGLLLLFFGNAIIVGDYRGLIAVAIVFLAFWFKLKKEERWLGEVFGDDYVAYTRTTKALLPWVL